MTRIQIFWLWIKKLIKVELFRVLVDFDSGMNSIYWLSCFCLFSGWRRLERVKVEIFCKFVERLRLLSIRGRLWLQLFWLLWLLDILNVKNTLLCLSIFKLNRKINFAAVLRIYTEQLQQYLHVVDWDWFVLFAVWVWKSLFAWLLSWNFRWAKHNWTASMLFHLFTLVWKHLLISWQLFSRFLMFNIIREHFLPQLFISYTYLISSLRIFTVALVRMRLNNIRLCKN